MGKFIHFYNLVKFEHTIFALPFALLGFFIGINTGFDFSVILLLKVIACMVFARNAAMSFNRYLDSDIDALNKRTSLRHIPAGLLSGSSVLLFVIVNSGLFTITSFFINSLCFYLSPVALFVILFYSYTKRITALCHLVLGLGLALAPIGAFIAVTANISALPIYLGIAVLLWVSGFDIIYAMQDIDFDKTNKLYSIPSYLGEQKARYLSMFLHALCAASLYMATILLKSSFPQIAYLASSGWFIFCLFLVYQHFIIFKHGLKKVDLAFFTANGFASLTYCTLVLIDLSF